MYCTQCGNKLADGDERCWMCGASCAPLADDGPAVNPAANPQHSNERTPARAHRAPAVPSAHAHKTPAAPAPHAHGAPTGSSANAHGAPAAPAAHANGTPTAPSTHAHGAPTGPSIHANGTAANPSAGRPNNIAPAALAAIAFVLVALLVWIVGFGGPASCSSDGGNTTSSASSTSAEKLNATDRSAPSDSAADSSADQTAPADDASDSAGQAASSEGGANSADQAASADRIQANGFSFELPDYWKDKVICVDTEKGVAIYPDTTLGTVEGYELATLELVSNNTPENGGDYVTHIAGRVRGDGVRVDVVSRNWAAHYGGEWYRHPNYAGSSQEQELVAALIDLSSGGACGYGDVRSAAESATNDGDAWSQFSTVDVDFLNETLIPTVMIDGADDAPGGSANAASLSDSDFESIAQTFGQQMFSSAEETGDGAMRWIGCDIPLQSVAPGSAAEANSFWQDTKDGSYYRIAKESKVVQVLGPRHYQVEVVYEAALDATGVNRQANIATVEIWLDESGAVEDIEVIRL